MFGIFEQSPTELPPHPVDLNYAQSPLNAAPAHMERTKGNTDLYITPFSDHAELMGEANIQQGYVMDDRLQQLDDLLWKHDRAMAEQDGPTTKPAEALDENQLLEALREKLELESKVSILAKINARLRGGIPDRESNTHIKMETALGRTAILKQTAVRANAPGGEVRLGGLEAWIIIDNLEATAADLRQQVQHESNLAAQANQQAANASSRKQANRFSTNEINHAEQADRLSVRANKMLALRKHLLKGLHHVEGRASVPNNGISTPLAS